jgi:hypothetical protein
MLALNPRVCGRDRVIGGVRVDGLEELLETASVRRPRSSIRTRDVVGLAWTAFCDFTDHPLRSSYRFGAAAKNGVDVEATRVIFCLHAVLGLHVSRVSTARNSLLRRMPPPAS